MAKQSKKTKEALAKFDSTKEYSLEEAVKIVKDITFTKFDASFDLDVRLGVDPRKANQMVRGIVTLPHGTGKTKEFWFCVLRIRRKRLKLPELIMLD